MKNIFKKSLALLLVLSMLSTLPMITFATEEELTETLKMTYDFGEAFAVADEYDFSAADAYYNLPLKNANSEISASPWKVGEFNLSNGQFEYNLGHLTRQWKTYGRAPEDTVTNSDKTHLIFVDSVQGAAGTDTAPSTYYMKRTGDHAYIGYSFGQINNAVYYSNTHSGSVGKYRGAVRFIVPRDGIVSPNITFYEATDYANMTDGTDGAFFRIYKLSDGVETTIYGGDCVAPSDLSEGWENIPGGQYTTYKNKKAAVNAGDEIVLVFDGGANTWAEEFELVSYQINYLEEEPEDDEITQKNIYNYSEAYAVDTTNYSFEGANQDGTTVYQNLPLVHENSEASASPWKIGYYHATTKVFTFYEYLSRGWYTVNRAPEDKVTSQSRTTSLAFGYGTVWKGPAGTEYGWNIAHERIGCNFGANTETNSFPGDIYGTYAKTRNAIRFVAPRDGYVIPTVKMQDDCDEFTSSTGDGVLFRIYKESGTVETPIIGGEEISYIDKSSGWKLLPAGRTIKAFTSDAVPVSEGDEIVLVFDPNQGTGCDEFCLYDYEIEYVPPISAYKEETYLSYIEGETNTIDMTRVPVSDSVEGTIVYGLTDDEGLLAETDKAGIYTLTGKTNYIGSEKGTPAVLTATFTEDGATEAACSVSTKIYISTPKNNYDFGEAFTVADDYSFENSGAENTTVYKDYALKYANSEVSASPWKVGYFDYKNSGKFTFYPVASRVGYTTGCALEDNSTHTVALKAKPRMAFGTGTSYKGPSGGYYGWQLNDPHVGYNFGTNTAYNSFSGDYWNKRQNAIRFVVPKSGVVIPTLVLAEDQAAYTSDDGVYFKLYKSSGGDLTPVYGGAYSSVIDSSTGWEQIPVGKGLLTTWTGTKVSVTAGDELVLVFDPGANTSCDEFTIYSYDIDYQNPIQGYKPETVVYYDEDGNKLVDLRVQKTLASDGGNVVYTVVSDGANALEETETSGVFELTGVLNFADYKKGTPIKLIASYYGAGESAKSGALPTYTSSTDLYVAEAVDVYDLREAYVPADGYSFTAGNDVADYNKITAKYENSESSLFPWKLGLTDVDAGYTFTYLPVMNRYSSGCRLIEDTVNSKYPLKAAYGLTLDTANGAVSGGGYIGYGYENSTGINSFSGNHNTKERSTVRFVVPRDGVINPVIKLFEDQASFTEGSTTDGVYFRAYKKSGNTKTPIYTGDRTVTFDNSADWLQIPPGKVITTWNSAKVGVKAGDEIVIEFDPGQMHWSDEFCIYGMQMKYCPSIDSYPEITEVTYDALSDDNTIDLRIEKFVNEGTIEYTVEDSINALEETETPGVYALAGVTNYNGVTLSAPVVVTASYFATGESSEQGSTPISTTSTTLYISSVLAEYDPFGYEKIKTTNLDMNEDSFFLPYYEKAEERALYGTIDLDLHERWAGSTVTFDKKGYLEYEGDGKVRVIGLYDHSKSAPKAVDSTDKFVTPGNSTLTARRDENTIGTPIKMTVTAPDGYSKSFNVLTFKAVIQDVEQYGSNVYRWVYGGYRGTSNRINNAVMSFETMHKKGDDYRFESLVPDPGKLSDGVLIPIQIAGNKYTDGRSGGSVDTYCKRSISGMGQNYITLYNGLYIGSVGIAQTFTAPYSGRIELSSFIHDYVYTWQSQYIGAKGLSSKYIIGLYDENDNLIKTLYKESFGPVKVDGNWIQAWDFYGDATYGQGVTGSREANALIFDIEKGQKVRVMFEMPDMSTLTSGQGVSDLGRFADPIFTYLESEIDTEIAISGDASVSSSASVTISALKDDATCAYFAYDSNGKMIGSGFKALEAKSTEVVVNVSADVAASYFKVYLWEDLSTLKTIGSTLILK